MGPAQLQELTARARRGDAQACFQLGIVLASQQRYAESRTQLQRASEGGHADALAWLGLHALYGYGAQPDLERALELLRDAERRGSPEAAYRLALMSWADGLEPRNAVATAERLVAAATRDHAAALRALALVYAREGGPVEACLARACALGDRVAMYLLGLRWQRGEQAARGAALIASAAALGLARAAERVPASAPLRLDVPAVRDLPLPALGTATGARPHPLSSVPPVETWDDFFSDEECEALIVLAQPHLARSVTVAGDGALQQAAIRTSSDTVLFGARDDFGSRWLQARMLDALGVPFGHGEHLVVLSYRPGEEYRPHHDFLPPGARGNLPAPDQPGQRVHTVFCYLDDVEAGGETAFPELGLTIAPKRGRIVHFRNVDDSGTADPRTLHAGLPVRAGAKWLATLWSRERRYRVY